MSEENKNDNTSQVNEEVIKEARLQGWVPKEEFRGSETDWIDADTFVKRGREINPILKQNNARLMKELDAAKKQMEEFRTTAEEFKKFQQESYKQKEKAYEQQIAELREEKKRAISSGDGELVIDIDDKIDALKEEKQQLKQETKEQPKQAEQQLDPIFQEWADKNSWYKTSVSMAAVANEEAEKIRRIYPSLVGKDFLDKVDEALEEVFSLEKLGRTKKERPRTPVSGGSETRPDETKGDKSYDKLPADAKAACDRFVKQKLMTREEYVASYQW